MIDIIVNYLLYKYIKKYIKKSVLLTPIFGTSIGVLGMKGAGKTQLYNTLRGAQDLETSATGTNDYDSFVFEYGDRKIKISKGRDIGGGDMYVREYYDKMIKEKDIIFFLFDVKQYMENPDYAKEVKARMDFIWNKMKDEYDEEEIKKRLVTIGSHIDQLDKEQIKNLKGYLQNDVVGKPYSPMFNNNFIPSDLKKRVGFMDKLVQKKIFG